MVLKTRSVIITFFLLLFLVRCAVCAQPLKFEHLSLEQGLAHGTVFKIIQDHNGFFWFGTANGVQRYDGFQFINYQLDSSDPHSLSDSDTSALFEDNEGHIWVGTRNGVNCLTHDHWFERYLKDESN